MKRITVIHELAPVFNTRSKVLLLGSMPSPKSRAIGFYYGNPQNRFWKVLSIVLNVQEPYSIEEKRTMLLEHGIALWDVLKSCTIIGANDYSIENALPNPIETLLQKTEISRIFCTGAIAHKLYIKLCEQKTGIKAIKLPSTSPANCAVKFQTLLEAYRTIIT